MRANLTSKASFFLLLLLLLLFLLPLRPPRLLREARCRRRRRRRRPRRPHRPRRPRRSCAESDDAVALTVALARSRRHRGQLFYSPRGGGFDAKSNASLPLLWPRPPLRFWSCFLFFFFSVVVVVFFVFGGASPSVVLLGFCGGAIFLFLCPQGFFGDPRRERRHPREKKEGERGKEPREKKDREREERDRPREREETQERERERRKKRSAFFRRRFLLRSAQKRNERTKATKLTKNFLVYTKQITPFHTNHNS